MPSSVRALHRRAGAVTFASQSGQSTGALLTLAGVAAPGPGPHAVPGRAGHPCLSEIPQAQPKRHGEE